MGSKWNRILLMVSWKLGLEGQTMLTTTKRPYPSVMNVSTVIHSLLGLELMPSQLCQYVIFGVCVFMVYIPAVFVIILYNTYVL